MGWLRRRLAAWLAPALEDRARVGYSYDLSAALAVRDATMEQHRANLREYRLRQRQELQALLDGNVQGET